MNTILNNEQYFHNNRIPTIRDNQYFPALYSRFHQVYMCNYVLVGGWGRVSACECKFGKKSEEGVTSLGAEVTDGYELCSVDARNQTLTLYKTANILNCPDISLAPKETPNKNHDSFCITYSEIKARPKGPWVFVFSLTFFLLQTFNTGSQVAQAGPEQIM